MSEVDRLLSQLSKERSCYLENYLKNAPRWLLEAFQVVTLPKDTAFVHENEPVKTVYILVEGIVKATDLRIYQINYDFMWFYPVEVFGAMEFLLDDNTYQTTLYTVTQCRMLKISKEQFGQWMVTDINALRMQTKAMTSYLLEQCRKERLYLFMEGEDRVSLLFTHLYEKSANGGRAVIRLRRDDIAKNTALSVRTVNRTIVEMIDKGILKKEGQKLILTHEQYERLRAQLKNRIDELK